MLKWIPAAAVMLSEIAVQPAPDFIDKLLSPQTFSFAVVAFLLVRMDGGFRTLSTAINDHIKANCPNCKG